MSNVKPTERDKYMTPKEFRRLVSTAAEMFDKPLNDQVSCMIYLGGAVGLRIGEAVSLVRWHCRSTKRGILYVPTLKQKKLKTKKGKAPCIGVGIDEFTANMVDDYLKTLPGRRQYLFTGKSKRKPMPLRSANYYFKKVVLRAGLNPNYSFHALRHYRGLTLWKQTRDLVFVQKQLRHRSVRHTQTYVHMSQEDIVKKVRAISPW
jgi:site-specific recombinase XerD